MGTMVMRMQNDEVEELKEKLRTIKQRVEFILANYPLTRNNDLYLWIIYLRTFSPEASRYIRYLPYDVFEKFPSFETITRIRRKLQEEGKYLPTDPEVAKRRRKLEKLMKKAIVDV